MNSTHHAYLCIVDDGDLRCNFISYGRITPQNPNMRYLVNANILAPAILRLVGKETYERMRSCPVSMLLLEQDVTLIGEGKYGTTTKIRLTDDEKTDHIHVEDCNYPVVTVWLPPTSLWEADGIVPDTPEWLEVALPHALAKESSDVLSLFYIHNAELTVNQLAKITRQDARRLIKKLRDSMASKATRKEILLASSVLTDGQKPGEWKIDLRGYALSVLIDSIYPESESENISEIASPAEQQSSNEDFNAHEICETHDKTASHQKPHAHDPMSN